MSRRLASLAVLAAAALVAGAGLAATGGGGGDPPPGTTAGTTATRPAPPALQLAVRYDAGSAAPVVRATLRCGRAAEGTRWLARPATAARACRAARRQAALLRGRRLGEVCTQQYGGPQTARVTGTIGGRRVAERFSRENGCRIAEWEALRPLLPRTRGAARPPGP